MKSTTLANTIAVLALTGLTACQHVGAFEPFREVECIERAKFSLKDAITAAEARGGIVLDSNFREDEELGCLTNNPGAYDITMLGGAQLFVVSVDANSGTVGPREQANVLTALFGGGPRFEGSPSDMARIAPVMETTISQAVEIAQRGGGKAMAAWVEAKNGRPGYTIKVVESGRVHVTWVDGNART
jgi:hypothetical protein